jgi:histidine triad (HIT) family protein
MSSIFSKIISGEIPCHRIWEDEEHLAFLDIQPLAEGHTLVVPKREEDYVFDLSAQRAEALWSAAHKVAELLNQRVSCERVAVLVLGYEVPHAHIHLIPTQSESEVLKPKRHPTDHPALARLAAHIRGESQEGEEGICPHAPTTAEIEDRWDEFAARFVSQVEHISLRAARVAIDHLQLETAESILEIGCGGGGAGIEIKRRIRSAHANAQLTLTDISSEMIKLATERFSNRDGDPLPKIIRADAQALPFKDHSFDRILSCLNLMLIPDPNAVLSESARVLKPGGLSAWVVWGRPEHSHMMTITGQALKRVGISLPIPVRSNFHLGGRDTLKELLETHGFDQVRRWYQPMITDVCSGEEFAKMTTALRPELVELAGDDQVYTELIQAIKEVAQRILDRGEAIGLDALIVIARRQE